MLRWESVAGLALGVALAGLGLGACGGPGPTRGRVEVVTLESHVFGNVRELRVWLPPGYDQPSNARRVYPVLYLNDGQNLFGTGTTDSGPRTWRVGETLTSLLAAGRIPPIIVVGIDNAGRRGRAHEYLPYPDEFLDPPEPDPQGGRYADFLAEDVMPLVEERFRAAPGREGRVLGGSSYGALASLYVAISRPELFSRLLLESPSFYVDGAYVLRDASAAELRLDRVYVGVGTNELALEGCPDTPENAEPVNDVMRFAGILRTAGLGENQILVRIDTCAVHNESAWAARLPAALEFLYSSGGVPLTSAPSHDVH